MRHLALALLAAIAGCHVIPDADRGAIYDHETRQPIAGASVTAYLVGEHESTPGPLIARSGEDGKFEFPIDKDERISHVRATANGYYPGVGIHRGRVNLRAVPEGAQPTKTVAYNVATDADDVGLRLDDGAIVPADQADVVVRVRSESWLRCERVQAKAPGGIRRIVSPMPHGIALEPDAAFANIVQLPEHRYSRHETLGTSEYGWSAYATYAVRTRDRQRGAKLMVAGFPGREGKSARVVVRYRLADPGQPGFVATTP